MSCRLFITAFWCSWISWRELSVTRRPLLCPGNSANDLHFLKSQAKRPAPKPDPDQPGAYLPNGAAAKAGLNKSILDAGWGQLTNILAGKAEKLTGE